MGITAKGLPYPEPADPIAAGADAIKALAEAVDPKLLTLQIQSGSVTLTTTQPQRVTFSPAFTVTPKVSLTPFGPNVNRTCSMTGLATTGVDVYLVAAPTGNAVGGTVHWIAVVTP